jgi:hypothetical protein
MILGKICGSYSPNIRTLRAKCFEREALLWVCYLRNALAGGRG